MEYARDGDVMVVHTLDRLGRTGRDTLLIHELAERGVAVRNLADPVRVDSSNPSDPMAQQAVMLLAMFGQLERTHLLERAARARAVATAKGRRIGRPSVVDANKLAYAVHLRDAGHTLAEIVSKTGITRTTLYRHPPPRPAPLLTAAPANEDVDRGHDAEEDAEEAPAAVVPAARPAPVTVDKPAGWSVAQPGSLRGAEELLEAVDWPQMTARPVRCVPSRS